ncbi:unnamed protein product [Cochlearia groenlandica]
MEQQKPKKRKVFQRNSSQSNSSSSSLHKDLTTEILLRLPEKSIAKFRRVSKLWLTITTDPYFIDLFETRYPRPSLLICYKEGENLFVSSIPQHRQTLELDSNKSYSYHMNLPKHCIFLTPTESVHGLICFQGSNQTPIVWNPSTRHFLALPKPRLTSAYLSIFLGYDPTKDAKHKKWSSKDFLAPYSYYDETLGNHFALKGITRDGEFIYVPAKCIPESIYVLFCDPARNSFRRFQLEQVVDKKSNLSLKTYLHAFTSHVESQNSM